MRAHHGGRVLGPDQDLLEAADDAQALAGGAALGDRVEPVLRRQAVAHRGAAQADAADAERARRLASASSV